MNMFGLPSGISNTVGFYQRNSSSTYRALLICFMETAGESPHVWNPTLPKSLNRFLDDKPVEWYSTRTNNISNIFIIRAFFNNLILQNAHNPHFPTHIYPSQRLYNNRRNYCTNEFLDDKPVEWYSTSINNIFNIFLIRAFSNNMILQNAHHPHFSIHICPSQRLYNGKRNYFN